MRGSSSWSGLASVAVFACWHLPDGSLQVAHYFGHTGVVVAVDGGQIGVVGFVARIDGLALLWGDEGMEDARLEASGGEGALHEAVRAAGVRWRRGRRGVGGR